MHESVKEGVRFKHPLCTLANVRRIESLPRCNPFAPRPFPDLREQASCIYMPQNQHGHHVGSPSLCTNRSPGFTFAPFLAIALNRQALLVALHPDHAWLLGKLRQGDALCQDHMDLPSFHVQLSPLPDVDILHRQSRHDINASTSDGQKERPTSLKQSGGMLFLPLAFLLLQLPALFLYLHYKVVLHTTWYSHLRAGITHL